MARNNVMVVMRSKGARKRHVQQELFRRGGKRKGAGRKPNGPRAGSPHKKRPTIKPYHALHVVMRVVPAIGSMRRRSMYKAMRHASIIAALRQRLRIVHLSIQRTHIYMLVEAENELALARGMQGFQISAAKHINAAFSSDTGQHRRGQGFADRYHVEVITSPRQARHALSYVLNNWRNNWRKHGEDRQGLATTWLVDPFSTGILFPDWQELEDKALMWPIRETYDPLMVFRPRSWILREGWKIHGSISAREIPARGTLSTR